MPPTQQTPEFIRELLEPAGPSCASFSDKKSLPLICYFVKALIYCFLADFFFQLLCSLGFPCYNLVLVLLLCFIFDVPLVTTRLGLASLDKLSGLFAIFKRSANQIKPLPHNKKN
jgi:hypothetical protein